MSNVYFYNQPLHQGLALVTPPAVEPVTLAEAKAWARVEIDDDDDLISGLITSARRYCEAFTKQQLITATYKLALDSFPIFGTQWPWLSVGASIDTLSPLQSVTSLQYLDMSGTLQTLDPSKYTVDTISKPGRITPLWYQPWPITRPQPQAVQLTYVAGFGDSGDDVPDGIKTAIKLLVSHWYRRREAVSEGAMTPVPMAVESLLYAESPGIFC